MSVDYQALCAAADRAACYLILPNEVAPSRRAAAEWGAKHAAALLGCRVPRIQWFRPATTLLGVKGAAAVGGDTILLAGYGDLTAAQTAGLAGHETLHAFGDADEGRAAALQRQVEAAWLADRLDKRDTIVFSG